MKDEGVAIVLVEQRIDAILSIADKAVIIENGRNVKTMDSAELKADPDQLKHYLGV